MTEKEAKNDPEMKTILLLSGFVRELGEGKNFEELIYKYAKWIVKLFPMPVVTKRFINWGDFFIGVMFGIFAMLILLAKIL